MVRNREKQEKKYEDQDLKDAYKLVKEEKVSIREAAEQRNVPRETLRRFVLKNRENDSTELNIERNFKFQKVFNDEEEKLLVEYLFECCELGYGLSVSQVRKRAWELARKNQIEYPPIWDKNGSAGRDWFQNFSKRHPEITVRKGENCSLQRKFGVSEFSFSQFYDNLESLYLRFPEILLNRRIYNLDETSTCTVQGERKVVAPKGQKQVYCNTSAERGSLVTTCGIICADGTMLPPAMIFPRVNYKRVMITGCYPGTLGLASPSGWMVTELFEQVLVHFIKCTNSSKSNQSILVLDNHESHISIPGLDLARDSGVHIITLVPHSSHKLQPLDKTVYGPVKRALNAAMAQWMAANPGKHVTIYEMAALVHEALLKGATRENILSGFKATGIYPFDRHIYDKEFEKQKERTSTASSSSTIEQDAVSNEEKDESSVEEAGLSPMDSEVPPQEGEMIPKDSDTYPKDGEVSPKEGESSENKENESGANDVAVKNTRTALRAEKRKFIGPKEAFGPPVDKLSKTTDTEKPARKKRKPGKTMIATDTPVRNEIEQERQAKRQKKSVTQRKPGKVKKKLFYEGEDEEDTLSEAAEVESSGKLKVYPDSFPVMDRKPVEGDFVLVSLHAPSGRSKSTVIYYVAKVIKNVDMDNDIDVSYLRTSHKAADKFVIPNIPDVDCVNLRQVKMLLPKPVADMCTKRQESLYYFPVDFSLLRMG